MQKYIMSLDQGTTSSRCIIFDHSGNIISLAGQEFPQIFPNSGWVEHDPVQIWSSQLAVMKGALTKASLTAADIKSIGITNQRETTVIWDKKSGVPIYNAIVWQCRRTAEMVEELKNCGMSDYIREKTGLVPDAYFSATKIAWLLDNVEGARTRAEAGELIFGTIDTWLIWNLTGGKLHVTDYTNASRTMLFDIHNLYWDEKILDALNIPKCILPNVHPSSYHFGETDPSILGTSIPLTGIAGDQQAALFGHCCFEKGDVKNTYGTGCFLLMNTGKEAIKSRHGLITTIAATMSDNVDYALEGSVFVAGAAIQWLRDGMRMIKSAAESEDYAEKVADTEGAYLVPAFTGLGAPYWNPYARGIMVGITRGFTKEHFIRAALESIAYQTADVLSAMEVDLGVKINGLKVCGGAATNNFLMQFQADILNIIVKRPECIETTALGAAYLAGLCVGFWQDTDEIKRIWQLNKSFSPASDDNYRDKLLLGWQKAVKCAMNMDV